MPYITSIERLAMEEGMEKGMEKGREEGLERGKVRGQLLGLAEGIALAIEIKFGEVGLQLAPLLTATQDVERLREVERAIRAGASFEEVRALLES